MRWIGRAILFFLCMGIVAVATQRLAWFLQSTNLTFGENRVDSRTLFTLRSTSPLRFSIPPQTDLVRITVFPRQARPHEAESASYHTFSVMHKVGSEEGTFYLRSRFPGKSQSQLTSEDGEEYLLDRKIYLPTPRSQSLVLELSVPSEADLHKLDVQVAAQIQRDNRETSLVWSRIAESTREELADASIVPLRLLTPEQRQALLNTGWQPIAPEGIPGADYDLVSPMVTESNHDSSDGEEVALDGQPMVVGPDLPLVLYFEQPQHLQIVGRSLLSVEQWDGATQRALRDQGGTWEVGPGHLVIKSAEADTVWISNKTGDTVPTTFGYLPMYVPGADKIVYSLHPAISPVVRLHTRLVAPVDHGLPQMGRLSIRWIGSGKQIVSSQELRIVSEPSPWDRAGDLGAPMRTSAATMYHLEVPAGAITLEIEGDSHVLVALSNRPDQMPWIRQLPIDSSAVSSAWFSLLADNDGVLREAQQVMPLRRQKIPDVEVEESLPGEFVTAQVPKGRLMRTLVFPIEPVNEPSISTFVEVGPEGNQLDPAKDHRLLYTGNPSAVFPLRMNAENGEIDLLLTGSAGVVDLPTGLQRIHGNSTYPGRLFVNHVLGGPAWKARTAPTLGSTPMCFTIVKDANEVVVNMEIFIASSDDVPRLKATLQSARDSQVREEFTFTDRVYQLPTDWQTERRAIVLASEKGGPSGPFYATFRLGSDIPQGEHCLQASWMGRTEGFIYAFVVDRRRDVQAEFVRLEGDL